MSPPLFRLLLNAHAAFPPNPTSTATWANTPGPRSTLALLPAHEQTKVLKYYFPRDASLSLGSFLLKHLAVVRGTGVYWEESVISVDPAVNNGKPFYQPGGVQFNVSHHGSLVVLVGAVSDVVNVGIDVVKLEDESVVARAGGWNEWIASFRDVFSHDEMREIHGLGTDVSGDYSASRLRRFYTFWALKEAYIKMTGEAFMINRLTDLEFRGVRVPEPAATEKWGDMVDDLEVWRRGMRVQRVRMELISFGEEYIVATAVKGMDESTFPAFEDVSIERDFMPLAIKLEDYSQPDTRVKGA